MTPNPEPTIAITTHHLQIHLPDGQQLNIPWEWYPRLFYGTTQERQNWELFGEGTAIAWPDLDEHLEIEGLLAGRQSGESRRSFDRWLAKRQAELTDSFRAMTQAENTDVLYP
jgi:hypothetical protein